MGPDEPAVTVGCLSGCGCVCGWKDTDLVVLRTLPLVSRMLLGVHDVSLSTHFIDNDDDLGLHEGGSKVVDLITDLH